MIKRYFAMERDGIKSTPKSPSEVKQELFKRVKKAQKLEKKIVSIKNSPQFKQNQRFFQEINEAPVIIDPFKEDISSPLGFRFKRLSQLPSLEREA